MAKTTIPVELSSTPGITDNSDATAITIDSSENVMMGTTQNIANSDANDTGGSAAFFGMAVSKTGTGVHVSSRRAAPLVLNRMANEGDLITFNQAGTAFGSIANEGGDALCIQSGTTSGSGLIFHPSNAWIVPARNTAKIDNAIDLGRSAHRFKDLYLSGGVYLGGTGSANKLTDYEEGTWTPTINDGVIASATGRYTKVGRMVTVTYNYTLTTLGSSNSMLIVGGLPFTSANNAPGSVGSVLCRYFTKNQIVSYVDYNASVITYYNNSSANFDQVSHGEVEASYDNDFEATGTHTYFV